MSYKASFDPRAMTEALYPNPFPGKYPTRIAIRIRAKTNAFEYSGKPTREVAQAFRREFWKNRYPWDKIDIFEFDQRGLLRSSMGGSMMNCSFANAFYPMVGLGDFGRDEKAFFLLHRKLVMIGKKPIYVLPTLFNKKAPYVPYVEFVRHCAKGNLNGRRFVGNEMDEMFRLLATASKEFWTRPVTPVEEKPVADPGVSLDVEVLTTPPEWAQQPMTWARDTVAPVATPEPVREPTRPGSLTSQAFFDSVRMYQSMASQVQSAMERLGAPPQPPPQPVISSLTGRPMRRFTYDPLANDIVSFDDEEGSI